MKKLLVVGIQMDTKLTNVEKLLRTYKCSVEKLLRTKVFSAEKLLRIDHCSVIVDFKITTFMINKHKNNSFIKNINKNKNNPFIKEKNTKNNLKMKLKEKISLKERLVLC